MLTYRNSQSDRISGLFGSRVKCSLELMGLFSLKMHRIKHLKLYACKGISLCRLIAAIAPPIRRKKLNF
ncbi:MAG: hypothetical protein HWQ38_03480 [Nostoc sp. NMS7]|uniref:hypothetical protein n=1 Tax=Nostoc sp. NMS7 TaxID=2815391 RepID=UPI0025FC1E85|nr:hypothetical protein [Nostoc sp. NMS7]MBN3945594.1 hypothetical protein [Nostoc sp. NMS7]